MHGSNCRNIHDETTTTGSIIHELLSKDYEEGIIHELLNKDYEDTNIQDEPKTTGGLINELLSQANEYETTHKGKLLNEKDAVQHDNRTLLQMSHDEPSSAEGSETDTVVNDLLNREKRQNLLQKSKLAFLEASAKAKAAPKRKTEDDYDNNNKRNNWNSSYEIDKSGREAAEQSKAQSSNWRGEKKWTPKQ